jgi:hypothetical protein
VTRLSAGQAKKYEKGLRLCYNNAVLCGQGGLSDAFPQNLAFAQLFEPRRCACLDFIRRSIENDIAGRLSAILTESVQNTAGSLVPPPASLHAQRVCVLREPLLHLLTEVA